MCKRVMLGQAGVFWAKRKKIKYLQNYLWMAEVHTCDASGFNHKPGLKAHSALVAKHTCFLYRLSRTPPGILKKNLVTKG